MGRKKILYKKRKYTKKFTSDFPSIKIYFFMDNQIKENFYCLIF